MVRNLGLGSWIARRARVAPDRLALVFEDDRFTYRELDRNIRRLARALQARGVKRGDRVAFLGRNHPSALETLFACGLLGALAVPVHPGFDEEGIAHVLAEAEPVALLATAELAEKARRGSSGARVRLRVIVGDGAEGAERYDELLEAGSDEPLDCAIGLDDGCLVAFTSGSTGPSKGVLLSHGNVLFNALNVLTNVDYVRDDVLLASAPLYRMGGLGFSLAVFLKGGACVLEAGGDPEASLARIARHRVTVLFETVAALEAMRSTPSFASADLSSLRICITGGSPVPVDLVRTFRRRGIPLQPAYGLTEASPLALIMDRDEVDAHAAAAGRPPFFGAARVVDGELEDVPDGTIGELVIHGPNVMRGYYRAPEATSRAIVEDGWLRTGDAAHTDAEGRMTVVGRIRDALTLSGGLAHPGTIEIRAREVGARDCAIVQRAPGESPIAFVVPDGGAFDADGLRALAQRRLGCVELGIRVIAELPKNANGKVRRDVLRAWLGA